MTEEPASDIEVEVTYTPLLSTGNILVGVKGTDRILCDYIRNTCVMVGYGRCCNKNKTVELYIGPDGQFWGLSTVLKERYFRLRRL